VSDKRARSHGRSKRGADPAKGGSLEKSPRTRKRASRRTSTSPLPRHEEKLRARLQTAEETLAAIRSGEVDALMVFGSRGEQVVTLKGGEPAYRMLVEAMSEGAVTLSSDGAVLYANRKFAEMIRRPPGKVIGLAIRSLVEEKERHRFGTLLATAQKGVAKGEFNLRSSDGSPIPVYLSVTRFRGYEGHALGMVITDLSEQKRKQAEEMKQTESIRRLLLERTLSAQEEERRRIARELHDEAGQLLTSLLVGLRTLEDSRDIEDAKAMGHRLREITAKAIDEVGRLARGLHPTVLDDHGLGVALRRYVTEYAKTHNISVDLKLNENASSGLPPAVQIGLYRILQEALTNVARHSKAKAVSIVFARSATALKVAVTDNGRGFDTKGVAVSSSRLGIQGMRERAAMLGGTVSFTSKGAGTRLLVQIPLTGQQDVQPLALRTEI
jgi:PAS domain S-box-containing protein